MEDAGAGGRRGRAPKLAGGYARGSWPEQGGVEGAGAGGRRGGRAGVGGRRRGEPSGAWRRVRHSVAERGGGFVVEEEEHDQDLVNFGDRSVDPHLKLPLNHL